MIRWERINGKSVTTATAQALILKSDTKKISSARGVVAQGDATRRAPEKTGEQKENRNAGQR